MSNFLDIKQGGKIRFNLPTAAGQTWLRGQVLIINTSSQLERYGSAAGTPTALTAGLALEQCVAVTTGNIIQNTNVVVAGQTGSILLGEAVVVNDNLSGTGGWVAGNSQVYTNANGDLTYTASSNLSGLGTCLVTPAANGRLTFAFRPPKA